jgi:malonyl-CoA/methylmalonyl-CoA synthetase
MRRNLIHALYEMRDASSQVYRFSGKPPRSTLEVRRLIARMASALRGLGVKRGDRISFKIEKCEEVLLLAHACLQLGAIIHPLNTAYTDTEVSRLVADADSRLLVVGEDQLSHFSTLLPSRGVVSLSGDLGGTLGAAASIATPFFEICDVKADDVAALLYTSGTTGRPKGARITHRNLVESARALAKVWKLAPADRLLHFLPMYHAHGLLTAINSVLVAGGSILFHPKFDPAQAVVSLPEVSVLMAVPTHYGRLLEQKGLREGAKFLRLAISGSAPLSQEMASRFEAMTRRRIIERYGATETAIVAALPAETAGRGGFVGWPLPGIEVRVMSDDGFELASGAIGNLETRGHNVFAGYWRNPQATKEAFTADGWFRTGDVAEIDESGCIRLLGRSRDIIITGGLNVYPNEVEAVIDGILKDGESAVFGVPHPDFGEAVVAVVDGAMFEEEQLVTALRKEIAPYKIPKRILTTAGIPKNQTGKVLKNVLRDHYSGLFHFTPNRGSIHGSKA